MAPVRSGRDSLRALRRLAIACALTLTGCNALSAPATETPLPSPSSQAIGSPISMPPSDGAGNTQRPNVVIVMLDDIGKGMDSVLFTQRTTPVIHDLFIQRGIDFANFYGETPLCCPGRANFLSGQHTHNHGVDDLDGTKFDPTVTIGTELQSAGYYTMLVGKYLNQLFPNGQQVPPGWSDFYAMYSRQGEYEMVDFIAEDGSLTLEEGYTTDVVGEHAISTMSTVPADQPIFALLAPFAGHKPFRPAPRHVGSPSCAGVEWTNPAFNEEDVSDKPQYIRDLPLVAGDVYDLEAICGTLLSVDEMVGRVAVELEQQGRTSNTIWMLTSDNGSAYGEHRLPTPKSTPYSTGIPMYVSWPQGRGETPRVEEETLSSIDLAPTLCEFAGCEMGPYPNGQSTSDGESFAALLRDGPPVSDREFILESMPSGADEDETYGRPPWFAVRTTSRSVLGLWHYVEYSTGELELYDVSGGPCPEWTPGAPGDPCELQNVAGNPEVADVQAALAQELDRLMEE